MKSVSPAGPVTDERWPSGSQANVSVLTCLTTALVQAEVKGLGGSGGDGVVPVLEIVLGGRQGAGFQFVDVDGAVQVVGFVLDYSGLPAFEGLVVVGAGG